MLINGVSHKDLCKWREDPERIADFAMENGSIATASPMLMGSPNRDAFLWLPLMQVKPSWKRGAQGIGDCFVAGTDVLMADGSLRPIEDVLIGEHIRTSTGNVRRVLDTIKKPYSGTLLTIRVKGEAKAITLTPDHNLRHYAHVEREPAWKAVGELRAGDKIQVPWAGGSSNDPDADPVRDGFAQPITAMIATEVASTHVYCLHVEDEHEFIANGVTAKNCVSWGAEIVATSLMAIQEVNGVSRFVEEAATEPIYGGCRVEAQGKSSGGWSDGAFGAAAAKWMRDWGVILRTNMAEITGNAEHDLRRYDKKRAKDWGNYGCGGKNDNDMLDGAARKHPIQHVVQIRSVEEAVAALVNGYPISIASSAGFGNMQRNEHGIVGIKGTWYHQMALLGVKFRAGEPLFRCFQSWGPVAKGPDPGIEHKAISETSWWITAADAAWIFKSGDCWAFGDIKGLPPRRIDWAEPAHRWAKLESPVQYDLAI